MISYLEERSTDASSLGAWACLQPKTISNAPNDQLHSSRHERGKTNISRVFAYNNNDDPVNLRSSVGGNIAITFTGEDGAVTLTVVDGEGGLDELHSIEKIVATARTDYLTLNGEIPDTYVPGSGTHSLEIDMGLGVDVIANASQASGAIIVDIDNAGSGTATSPGTGGVIHLLNAKTQILGSAYHDEITDLSVHDGVKRIDGGAGDDVVTGGDGDDMLRGASYDNNEADQLNGGGGSDYILGLSAWETIDGGDGHDYIQAFVNSTVRGGAGHDFINFGTGINGVGQVGNVIFGAADGHDTLVSGNEGDSDIWFEGLSKDDVTIVWDDLGGTSNRASIGKPNISYLLAANNNNDLVDLRSCA